MRLVDYLEGRSVLLHPYRWWLGGTFGTLVILMTLLVRQQTFGGILASVLFAMLSFFLMWAWGLICLITWLHPQSGTMRYGSRWWLGMPRPLQTFFRAYGAVFLVIWFAMSFLFLVLLSGIPIATAA